jgi:hypothetical protein
VSSQFDIRQCINPDVLERLSACEEQFAAGEPFPHLVIDDFLLTDFCTEIIAQFPDFDERTAINEDGRVGGKSTREEVRQLGPVFTRLDQCIRSQAFLDTVGRMTGIGKLKYDPMYYGGGTHENRHGQDLDPHIDFNYHPISRQHRRLNLILFLNDEWEDHWGGLLQLHQDPYREPGEDHIVSISPKRNRCVIFETSERSWHGFQRIGLPAEKRNLSRKSFAVYFYTDDRPPQETADEHSTIYVDRQLPEYITPGLTLEEQHVRELQTLLSRRDQHLQRLYGEVRQLRAELSRSRLLRLARTVRRWVYGLKR